MDKVEKDTIKKLDFEKTKITMRETYIDENGHERCREKQIEMPVFLNDSLSSMTEKIYKEIEKLPIESKFTIKQFMENYNILEEHKYSLCSSVLNLCKNSNIVIEEVNSEEDLELPWDIIRIKKK